MVDTGQRASQSAERGAIGLIFLFLSALLNTVRIVARESVRVNAASWVWVVAAGSTGGGAWQHTKWRCMYPDMSTRRLCPTTGAGNQQRVMHRDVTDDDGGIRIASWVCDASRAAVSQRGRIQDLSQPWA